jgi:PKD repeat protein
MAYTYDFSSASLPFIISKKQGQSIPIKTLRLTKKEPYCLYVILSYICIAIHKFMNKLYLVIGLIILTFHTKTTQAQISISNTDMPVRGQSYRYSTSNTSVQDLISLSGENKEWDASKLVPNFQNLATYRQALAINFLYAGAFGQSTYGTEASGFSAGLIQGEDVFQFFTNTNKAYVSDGRAFSVQGLPLSQTWKDTLLRFPVTYGTSDSNSFTSNEVNALIATIKTTGKRVNVVDGWGKITTPYGTFDCVRVRSIIRLTDTIKTSLVPGFAIPVPQNATEYRWYTKNEAIPILEITVQGFGQAQVKYKDISRPEAFNGLARFAANKTNFTSQNQRDTCFLNDQSLQNPSSRLWEITPSTFQFYGGTSATSQRAKVYFTAPGVYTVKLTANYAAGKDDTTRVNYIRVTENNLSLFNPAFNKDTKLYPNPTSAFIILPEIKAKTTFTLWNMQGVQCGTWSVDPHENQIDIKGIAAGIYTLAWQTDNQFYHSNIIISEQ